MWDLNEILKKHILKIWKKSWVPFRSYLLNSTANSAQFEWKWAGLAVLFSTNSTHDFFQIFRICFFKDFIKNPQTTIALTFLTYIISGIDGVITHVFCRKVTKRTVDWLLAAIISNWLLKFIYSEKATKFCKIFTLLLIVCTVKPKSCKKDFFRTPLICLISFFNKRVGNRKN